MNYEQFEKTVFRYLQHNNATQSRVFIQHDDPQRVATLCCAELHQIYADLQEEGVVLTDRVVKACARSFFGGVRVGRNEIEAQYLEERLQSAAKHEGNTAHLFREAVIGTLEDAAKKFNIPETK
jgi:hypothetical protein